MIGLCLNGSQTNLTAGLENAVHLDRCFRLWQMVQQVGGVNKIKGIVRAIEAIAFIVRPEILTLLVAASCSATSTMPER